MPSRIPLRDRLQIQDIRPCVDAGRYAAKAVVGDLVAVSADIFREGHDRVAAVVEVRGPGDDEHWQEAPLALESNDRWDGTFGVDRMGPWRYRITAWTDHYASWLDGLRKKHAAGQTDLGLELEEGARLLERRPRPTAAVRASLDEVAALLRGRWELGTKVEAAGDPALLATLLRHPERLDATTSATLPLWVDRERARFSAWYELFPRSEGGTWPDPRSGEVPVSGTFATAAERLPAVAQMGFDVVYLPPIHPIGRTNRKGARGPHDLEPGPHDPGVPWAIGSEAGGHDAVHPDLGTLADFDAFVAKAAELGMEVALDFAIQCSPDHPWVTEHPEWFRHRADGSIAYAENPPKQYQDIYPIDFDTPDLDGLYAELKRVVDFWLDRGIRVLRVDNPHTKALPFWEWLIADVHARHPDVILLAEAFTRPKMMTTLAKLGFGQSYTYFTWRSTKAELTSYATELAHTELAQVFRPNFWPNTPDILARQLQRGGWPAFRSRLVLAATLSPSYGIYAGYELGENTPLAPGSEEYLGSEKYRYHPRDWSAADSLAGYIGTINAIRAAHPALRELTNLRFHHIDNDQLLCYSKAAPHRTDPILVIVNLDPHHPQEATTWLDLWQLGLEHAGAYEAHDLLTDQTFVWHGPENYVRLDPAVEPCHILSLRQL